jgi:hypothetical protein
VRRSVHWMCQHACLCGVRPVEISKAPGLFTARQKGWRCSGGGHGAAGSGSSGHVGAGSSSSSVGIQGRTPSCVSYKNPLLALRLAQHLAEVWTLALGETPAPLRRWRARAAAAPHRHRLILMHPPLQSETIPLLIGLELTDQWLGQPSGAPDPAGGGHPSGACTLPWPAAHRLAHTLCLAHTVHADARPQQPGRQAGRTQPPAYQAPHTRSAWIEGAATNRAAPALHIANHRVFCS